ncbi:MAG: hypothetical protein JNK64_20910 [Myxococcales bacterium]|nr:hypothetical protein [Myxococcales bacterium]
MIVVAPVRAYIACGNPCAGDDVVIGGARARVVDERNTATGVRLRLAGDALAHLTIDGRPFRVGHGSGRAVIVDPDGALGDRAVVAATYLGRHVDLTLAWVARPGATAGYAITSGDPLRVGARVPIGPAPEAAR